MASRYTICGVVGVVLLAGCRTPRQIRDPEYARVSRAVYQAQCSPRSQVITTAPVFEHLAGPHPLEEYIQVALAQNPDVQAARKEMESLAHQVPVAASLSDPMVGATGWPFFPNVPQTAAGRMTAELMVSQQVPWHGKLHARAAAAEAETNAARAQLAATELRTIEGVKKAYWELYYVQQAIAVTEAERGLMLDLREVANTRYRTGTTSQQDVLRADLEVSSVDNELIRLRQQLVTGQARLARLLHIAPQTKVATTDTLSPEQVPRDLEMLQLQAVEARPELHAQLAMLQKDREMVEMARLEYYPDFNLKAGWGEMTTAGALAPSADGLDNVTIGMDLNIPIYRKRLDSSVRSAEAKVVSTAREYDSMRDGTLEEVTDLFAQARSQEEMLVLFREDILPKARQTLAVSNQAYNVGEVDFLTLLDNWRQLLRYETNNLRLEASLRQTLAELERVVGGFLNTSQESIPAPAAESEIIPPTESEP